MSVVAISIGGMLGSGIFVLPGLAAAKTGPSIWLANMLASFCVLPAALSKSELATAMPTSGGAYVYIGPLTRYFGPLPVLDLAICLVKKLFRPGGVWCIPVCVGQKFPLEPLL